MHLIWSHLWSHHADGTFWAFIWGVIRRKIIFFCDCGYRNRCFPSGFSRIASLFCLLFIYLEWCSARIFLNCSEILRLSLWGESTIAISLTSFVFTVMLVLLRPLLLFDTHAMGNYLWIWWNFFYSCTEQLCHHVLIISSLFFNCCLRKLILSCNCFIKRSELFIEMSLE